MKEVIRIGDGWGYREISLMADLLEAYANNPRGIEKPIRIEFDPSTAYVHLVDRTKTEYRCIAGEIIKVEDDE